MHDTGGEAPLGTKTPYGMVTTRSSRAADAHLMKTGRRVEGGGRGVVGNMPPPALLSGAELQWIVLVATVVLGRLSHQQRRFDHCFCRTALSEKKNGQ